MKIQKLSNKLSHLISALHHTKRKIQMGIFPPSVSYTQQYNKMPELIRINMVEPIVQDLRQNTNENISYQLGTSVGFYYLLVNSKKFAIMYIPNPASGAVFIKYLNQKGMQCTASMRLNDTCQIIDYLKEFPTIK